ncbi:hypothetical protein OG373_01935 [Streptomyces avidinii]|uniref:hypothetical protein n=1 Tax=Streptomyces avidinii TaxID=1895 RepID=UPI00386B67B0|nr:hypothetical protein OG373_01935 [Streptomyces avidinii]
MALICGHDAPAYGLPLCEHIRNATAEPLDHYLHYTGRGLERQRVCGICRHEPADEKASTTEAATVAAVCEDCFDATEGSLLGVFGHPGTIDESRPVRGIVETTALPDEAGKVLDIAPTNDGIVLLCEDGRILRRHIESGRCTEVARSTITVPADAEPWCGRTQTLRLHASRDGAFAAVVIDYGRTGEVIDLSTGAVTLPLENDGYHSDTVPFSLAFTEHAGRVVVLHRRQWSLIEATDPATGAQVACMPTGDDGSAPWAGHFHGALYPSPAGSRCASDAWVWHPSGRPVAWNLDQWLTEGERAWTEDIDWAGLPGCAYYWDRSLVRLDEDRLVLEGLGDVEEELVPGARVFDLGRRGPDGPGGSAEPVETVTFAGPRGRFFAADGLLFSSSESGFEIWNPATGARLGTLAGFRPTHHDPIRGELIELSAIGLRRWRTADATA